MRYGVVSDIHANIQAWKAVLRDMKNNGVDVILCLGDVVGYGPNPAEVLDSCYEHVDYFILGNHDAVIGNRLDSSLFNDNAKYLIEWTRDQLNPAACDFFSDMPLRMEGDGFVCAHGELAMPGRFGYIYEAQDAIASFTSNQSPIMFVGHTHFPAKFVLDMNTNSVRKDLPGDAFLLPNERYLINAGSVGDPRDGNTAASYCIYDTESSMIKFRQVPFDIEKFRANLERAQLPVNPFFLRVYDGQQAETETIKDMQVMESNQTTEASPAAQRIIRVGEDVKTRRKKLNFSLDERSTRHFKAQEATRKEAEAKNKKKGKAVVLSLVAALIAVFLVVIIVVKSGKKEEDVNNNKIVNDAPDFVKEEVVVIKQNSNNELLLPIDKASLPEGTSVEEASNLLIGWTKQTSKLDWTVDLKNKGWYELFIEHAKTDAAAEVRLKIGPDSFDFVLEPTEEGKILEKSLGSFEMVEKGRMNAALIALRPGPDSVTALKSLRIKFHGDKKPNPYGELDDIVFEDFDSPHFSNEWIIKGEAFPHRPLSQETISPFTPVKGVSGDYCAGSMNGAFETKDDVIKAQGTMISRKFIIKHRYIHMLARGGDNVLVCLSVKGNDVISKKPPHNWPIQLVPQTLNVTDYIGEEARLIFRDKGERNIVFDNIVFSNKEVADFPKSIKELNREIPKVIENKGDASLTAAGKQFLEGNIDNTIAALISGESAQQSPVNKALYKQEAIKFSEMKTNSKKKVEQLDSMNVSISGCNDKDTIILKGAFKEAHDLKFLELEAVANGGKPAGHAGNGNFFLSGITFEVTRKELLNKGKYVRISLSGNKTLSLAEVQVMSGEKNVAQGKNASQISTGFDAPASLAVDGKTDGKFDNKSVTHTDGGKNPWWEVDLGEEFPIDKIIVFNRIDKVGNDDMKARLNRYSISVLDTNRKVIWQDFIHEAKEKHEHRISEKFKVNFDFAKATYANSEHYPWKCIHSKNPNSGWSIHGKQGQSQTAWFGLNEPLLINESDDCEIRLFFNSGHKKHVMRKVKLTVLSEDKSKFAEYEEKFKEFLNFESAIIDSFKQDVSKIIDYKLPVGKEVKVQITAVTDDGRIGIRDAKKRRGVLTFDKISQGELEKRALAMPNGQFIWAHYKGELAEKAKELEYDKDTFIGSLIEAGSKVFVAKHDPMILTGRYIEIWRQANEKNPKFDIIIDSSGQKLTKTPKTVKFKELYPNYPVDI